MNNSHRWAFAIVFGLFFALSGCMKKDLDRGTAMKLLQGRNVGVVGSFQAYADYVHLSSARGWYQQLINARVITCGGGPVCGLGPSGTGLQLNFTTFSFAAGTLTPVDVTGVAQTGPNSASAEVRLAFQPSPLYAQYRNTFDHLTAEAQVMGGGPVQPQTQRNAAEAVFQRYDDGWRLQSLDNLRTLAGSQVPEVAPPPSTGQPTPVANANKKNGQALIDAAGEGNLAEVQALLAEGVDINTRASSDGWTPVDWAAQNCHLEILKLLIARGADLNVKDPLAYTAVGRPQSCNEAKKLLQASGAKMPVEKPMDTTPWRCGRLPSEAQMRAAAESSDLCVKALNGSPTALGTAPLAECRDSEGRTPLMVFAAQGVFPFISDIVRAGVDVNARDHHGCTALMYAEDALKHSRNEHDAAAAQDTIERLRKQGAQ